MVNLWMSHLSFGTNYNFLMLLVFTWRYFRKKIGSFDVTLFFIKIGSSRVTLSFIKIESSHVMLTLIKIGSFILFFIKIGRFHAALFPIKKIRNFRATLFFIKIENLHATLGSIKIGSFHEDTNFSEYQGRRRNFAGSSAFRPRRISYCISQKKDVRFSNIKCPEQHGVTRSTLAATSITSYPEKWIKRRNKRMNQE